MCYHTFMLDMRMYMANRRSVNREKSLAYLGGQCSMCGSTKNLQFDHKERSNKSQGLADMFSHAWENIVIELKKCQLLCILCHIKKTQNEASGPSTHGKVSYYRHHKCRCELCTKANRESQAEWRERTGKY